MLDTLTHGTCQVQTVINGETVAKTIVDDDTQQQPWAHWNNRRTSNCSHVDKSDSDIGAGFLTSSSL